MPSPRLTPLCDTCGGPWEKHLRRAKQRWVNEHLNWDLDDDGIYTEPEPYSFEEHVTLQDCIAVLKAANQGPEGPPGPTGAMGAQGLSAPPN